MVTKPCLGEVDIYRDTPVRLLGYANEVGEAFRALVGGGRALGLKGKGSHPTNPILASPAQVSVQWVRASYGVASAYVLADTYDKADKMNK